MRNLSRTGGFFFYTATIAFALGIFVRSFVSIEVPLVAFLCFAAFVFGVIWRRDQEAVAAPFLLCTSIALLFVSLGMLRMEAATWYEGTPAFSAYEESELTIEGVVQREPDLRASSVHLYVSTEEGMLLVIGDKFTDVSYGDRISVTGTIKRPEAFETDLGRTFNYPGYLNARGVTHMIRYGGLTVLARDEGNPAIALLFRIKHTFMGAVERLIPEPQSGLGEGLLLGVKRALGEDLEQVFRTTGIIHIVVLSGYNIMLVVVFVGYLSSFLFGVRGRTTVGVVCIILFALLVGLSATVLRASIMAGLLLIAHATGAAYAVMRALMAAGCVMLLINPYLLAFDTGFQLSFAATIGLILAASPIEAWFSRVPSMFQMRSLLAATIATQIFVLPLLLYQIGELSLVSIFVNVLVLPMVPAAMLLTFLTGMIGMFAPTLALPIAFLAYVSLSYILVIPQFFAALPLASVAIPSFSFWFVPISYAGIGFVTWRLLRKEESETVSTPIRTLEGRIIAEEMRLLLARH